MVDEKGILIAHLDKEIIFENDITQMEGMSRLSRRMLARETGVEEYQFKGVDKIACFASVPSTGWSIAVTQNESEFMGPAYDILNIVLLGGGISLALIILGVLWFSKGITLPINRIVAGLGEGSVQVASASTQVSSASQALAEGASEQAASIEETSSSMEQMSAMTRKNSENAEMADGLMLEANQIVTSANESMEN